MSDDADNKMKIRFAPGCFDGFTGSQEELDELVQMILAKVEDGSIFTDSMPVEQFLEQRPDLVDALAEMSDGDLSGRISVMSKQLTLPDPRAVQFVENMTDAEVTDMLQALEAMEAYPHVNHTLH